MSISEREITTHRDQKVVSSVMIFHVQNIVHHLLHLLVSVESSKSLIINNWTISVESFVIPETAGPAIVVLHCSGKDLDGFT
jgi:hypothetical protein